MYLNIHLGGHEIQLLYLIVVSLWHEFFWEDVADLTIYVKNDYDHPCNGGRCGSARWTVITISFV